MPGVPFSKACEACKRRRVKCDEKKPECTQCIRLGKGPCPGYRHENKFIDEGERIRKKKTAAGLEPSSSPSVHIKSSSSVTSAALSREPSLRGSPSPVTQRWVSPKKLWAQRSSPYGDEATPWLPHPFSAVMPDGLLRTGFEIMMLTHLPVPYCGRIQSGLDYLGNTEALRRTLAKSVVMPSYVSYIPQRMGTSPLLDSTIDLVFSATGSLLLPATETVKLDLMGKYGLALYFLRQGLLDPVESMTVEVLAAAALLSTYECINSTSMNAWMNHHRGVGFLVEKRGVRRFQTDFERQILLSCMGTIFTVALRDNLPCFLDQPEWQDVLATKPADSIIEHEWVDSYACIPLLCFIPRLLAACREIVRDKSSQTEDRINTLVASATLLRKSFLDLADRHGWKSGTYSPVLAPRDPDDDFRVFHDADDQRAGNFANYLSAIAIINRIIFALRPSAVHLEKDARAAGLEIQYIHSFIKTEPKLRGLYIVHSERMALAVVLTSNYWSLERDAENGGAFDPKVDGGGHIIERWKFDVFDDILTARTIDAPLMWHYPIDDQTPMHFI